MSLNMFSNYETIGDKKRCHPQVFPTIVNITQMVSSAILTTPTITDLDWLPYVVGLELLI